MNLSEEQLKRIEELAYRTITVRMIANAVDVDEIELLDEVSTPGTPARKAVMTGICNQMVETREAIIKAARNGSNPAQSSLLEFLEKQIYTMDK